MKKLIFTFFSLFMAHTVTNAAVGDTTVVTTHDATHLETYTNYDTAVIFPDGTTDYRKIVMEFELGKYACPGYNPNNPGENAGQTGWCSDWDYDVHIIACKPNGDTLEMGELITPYANSNFPRTPLTWKHSYLFDVTDFYPILKDSVTIRIFYAGWSGGFTGTVKFHLIEGTRPRDVVAITKLWHGGFEYGNAANSIEDNVAQKNETMPIGATSAEAKIIISGHGNDSPEGCSEFCKKWYQFKINGTMVHQQDIWRDNCGSNFLYPQSGTWIYDRGNWCPGDQVETLIEKVPTTVSAGQNYTVDMDFEPYTSTNGGASYKVSAIMFYYGDFNKSVDAGLEAIISPNNDETYYRENPICNGPVVKLKNFGSTTITTVKFSYGVVGETPVTYVWNGNLASLKETNITLADLPALRTVSGNNNHFFVTIAEVNGAADEDNSNNSLTSTFAASPEWSGGYYIIQMNMSGPIQGITNKVNWTIKDGNGTVVASRNGTQSSVLYKDTVALANGCYRLDVDASYLGFGMSFLGNFASGYVRAYNLTTGTQYPLPKTDLGHPALAGNFGNGFTQYFSVTNSTGILKVDNNIRLNIYPNPATDQISIHVEGTSVQKGTITLSDALGKIVFSAAMTGNNYEINTATFASGVYTLNYASSNGKKTEKVVIRH